MKICNRYMLVLFIVAALVVTTGGIAHLFGASIEVLAPLALIQMIALLALFLTSLASFAFAIGASVERKWREAATYAGAAAIPLVAWTAAALTNGPGWEAVMGI